MRRSNPRESAIEDSLYIPLDVPARPRSELAASGSRTRSLVLRRLFLGVVLLVVLPYFFSPVYTFPPPQPFAGPAIWNPYAGVDSTWLLANLHAHGAAWGGITNGRQSDDAVVEAYRTRGYDVAEISDYQRIAALDGVPTIPAYEHGYNVSKIHQLAIGARAVDWLDFPLFQWTSQKQFVIDRVKARADLVALVHPSARLAYSEDDLHQLTGYDLFEVINGRFPAEDLWDAALSSGHFVGAIGDDDTHDITDPHRMAVAWTMIDADAVDAAAVVSALRRGRSYAVSATSGTSTRNDAVVSGVQVRDGRLTVSIEGPPATFSFIRQDGQVRKTVEKTTTASYDIAPDDAYVRTEIRTPKILMYLNPVVRYDGAHLPDPVARVDTFATWALRLMLALGCAAAVALLGRRDR
ncbi:MAG: hypothetical protein ACM3SQ_20070 [Betaproteobacteria bacterium]